MFSIVPFTDQAETQIRRNHRQSCFLSESLNAKGFAHLETKKVINGFSANPNVHPVDVFAAK